MNTANSGITAVSRCRQRGRDSRVRLHFGAVDWRCQVWVNGASIGQHQGGYEAFTFDITDALRWNGVEEISVCVDGSDGRRPAARQTVAQARGDFLHFHFRHLADGLAGAGARTCASTV